MGEKREQQRHNPDPADSGPSRARPDANRCARPFGPNGAVHPFAPACERSFKGRATSRPQQQRQRAGSAASSCRFAGGRAAAAAAAAAAAEGERENVQIGRQHATGFLAGRGPLRAAPLAACHCERPPIELAPLRVHLGGAGRYVEWPPVRLSGRLNRPRRVRDQTKFSHNGSAFEKTCTLQSLQRFVLIGRRLRMSHLEVPKRTTRRDRVPALFGQPRSNANRARANKESGAGHLLSADLHQRSGHERVGRKRSRRVHSNYFLPVSQIGRAPLGVLLSASLAIARWAYRSLVCSSPFLASGTFSPMRADVCIAREHAKMLLQIARSMAEPLIA